MNRNPLVYLMVTFALLVSGCADNNRQPTAVSSVEPPTGAVLYEQTCAKCHGDDARGRPNVGKDLITSALVQNSGDEELLAFIIRGLPVTDPANTTGIPMPPRGGNPALTDDQLMEIIAWIRTLP